MSIEETPKVLEGEEQVRDALTSDYVNGVKERAQLKEEIETLTKELNRVKSQNYDLTKKLEKLENEVLKKHVYHKPKQKTPETWSKNHPGGFSLFSEAYSH